MYHKLFAEGQEHTPQIGHRGCAQAFAGATTSGGAARCSLGIRSGADMSSIGGARLLRRRQPHRTAARGARARLTPRRGDRNMTKHETHFVRMLGNWLDVGEHICTVLLHANRSGREKLPTQPCTPGPRNSPGLQGIGAAHRNERVHLSPDAGVCVRLGPASGGCLEVENPGYLDITTKNGTLEEMRSILLPTPHARRIVERTRRYHTFRCAQPPAVSAKRSRPPLRPSPRRGRACAGRARLTASLKRGTCRKHPGFEPQPGTTHIGGRPESLRGGVSNGTEQTARATRLSKRRVCQSIPHHITTHHIHTFIHI